MRMSEANFDRMHQIRDLRNAGMTFREIGNRFGISNSRARDIYNRSVYNDKEEAISREFAGLDWIPANGIYKEGITTREQLEALPDIVILYILNKQYSGTTDRPRTDLLNKVRAFLGRGDAETDAAE